MRYIVRVLILLAFVGPGAMLAIVVHELGHVAGGRLGGLRFVRLIVGPLRIRRGADHRLRWERNTNLSQAGGIAVSVPQRAAGLRSAFAWFAAGGPVVSLVVGLVALAAYGLLDGRAVSWGTHPPALVGAAAGLFAFGAALLVIGLGTLAPLRVGGFTSDGGRLLRLWRPGPAAERHAAVMALGSYDVAGQRPRDWPAGVVATALAAPDGSYDAILARFLAYFHALDREDSRAAAEHLQYVVDHLAQVPDALRPALAAEAAYFDAAYRGEAAGPRARLAEAAKSPLLHRDTRRRAEAAVLLAAGELERAGEKIRELYADAAGRDEAAGSSFLMAELERLCRMHGLPASAERAPLVAR